MLITFNSEFRQKLVKERDRVPFDVRPNRIPIFPANINTYITPFALRLVKKQWQLVISGEHDPNYTGSFTNVYGLPCCHDIRTHLNLDPKWFLSAEDFHAHWWFERPKGKGPALHLPSPPASLLQPITEPNIVRSRGRPRREDQDTTTHRDPSQWEIPVVRGPQPVEATDLINTTTEVTIRE
jgi:hypothetical protein